MQRTIHEAFGPLKRATIRLIKENYKIIDYGDLAAVEWYDLYEAINQNEDLSVKAPALASSVTEELLAMLRVGNKSFENLKQR